MSYRSTSILCRGAVQLPAAACGELMYMPGGRQEIVPLGGGIGAPIEVEVDAAGAAELERQRAALAAKGRRPYFDFNHEDGSASFWPEEFFWADAPEPGIYCRGEWTARGKESVEGKEWRQFSPVFHVDDKRARPARIVCRETAKANMGGLVNDPAFHTILPLWAKAAGASGDREQNKEGEQMNEQELAALRATIEKLEQEVSALRAKDSGESAAELKAKQAELKAAQAEVDADAARKENAALKAKIAGRNKADAEAAVKRAVERGALAAKDADGHAALVAKGTEDPGFLRVIDGLQGQQLAGRITPAGARVENEAPNAKIKAFAGIVCRNAKLPLTAETAKEKGRLAREAAAIFAKDIEGDGALASMSMDDAIKAADNADASVGLLSGTLVLQRALPLMQHSYPILSQITADFSDAPGLLNQTETTRIILKHAVQTRSTSVDNAGRPVGWSTVSPAQSADVSVTLTDHVGVPVVFGQDILASTVRNLFAEQAPMALYALGGYAVNLLTALMTSANFNAYAGTSLTGGATTSGSVNITFDSSALVYPGQAISGTGIPANSYIASVTSATAAKLTQKATATGSALTFTVNDSKVPNVYATYAKALADFDVAAMGEIKAAFDTNEVPEQDRFALLNSAYHTKLANTPVLNNFFAAMQKPEIVTKGSLPEIQGFSPINAPYFPTTNSRVGFAGHRASLVLKSRLPNDITSAVGAMVPGSVTTVTAPGGISVLLVQYVSLREGYAEWRPEVMLGAAAGERRCGLVITSA